MATSPPTLRRWSDDSRLRRRHKPEAKSPLVRSPGRRTFAGLIKDETGGDIRGRSHRFGFERLVTP